MHAVGINLVSFTAQICIHKITTEIGGGGGCPLSPPAPLHSIEKKSKALLIGTTATVVVNADI